MRVVHILTVPLSFRLLKGQASYLAARGVDVHAISSPGELADQFERSEPGTVHRVPMTRSITPFADLIALVRLVRLLRELRPDVVQCGTPKAGLLGTTAAWLVGVPVRIYHVRGLPLTTATGVRRTLLLLTERIACAAATHVLSVSHSVREVLAAEQIRHRRDVDVLLEGSSNGVDANAFDPNRVGAARQSTRAGLGIPADALVIGFVGRLVHEKGLDELHTAWQGLRAVHPEAHLLLIGPFESEDAISAHRRAELENDPRVHLTGLSWDTPALYAAMDVFCLPSYREGFPNVVLEASSMRLPVVATRIPGSVDAVSHGVTGTLVPVRDAGALEEALARYAADPALRARHGAAGREAVLRSFAQERIWAALLQYYRTSTSRIGASAGLRKVLHVVTVPVTLEFMAGQTAFMRERGIALSFASSPGEEQTAFARREGTVVHSVPMSRRMTPLRDVLSVVRLLALLGRERPGVVHAHTPKAGIVTMLASWVARVPVRIYHVHGLPYETATGMVRRIQKGCEAVSCALATRVLPVSASVARQMTEDRLCRQGKMGVLASGSIGGVDARQLFNPVVAAADGVALRAGLGIDAAAPIVGFVGRLTRDKGIEVLWRAWARVKAAAPDAHLLLVGPHDTARADQALRADFLEALQSDPRVHIVGAVPRTDLPRYYAAMDVLCLPTYREGFPVTLLEAAAMALPSVATRVTGCVDAIVDGRTGTLVEPRDAAALSAALTRYLGDASLRQAHGAAARDRVLRHFTPEQVWTAFAQEYRQAASRRPAPGWYARRGKRLFDLTLLLLTAPVWIPVLAAVWLLVRVRLGAPTCFRQSRPGKDGRIFTLVKFRTMTDDRDAAGELLPDGERLTAFGRRLRSSSLDELPELWNVLKGEMSLVGPRPLLVQYLARYTPDQSRRHQVRPGLTGLAQVNGRNALGWDERFALDVWYVDNCSLLLDLKILGLTVWKVATRRGISEPGHATAQEFMGTVSR